MHFNLNLSLTLYVVLFVQAVFLIELINTSASLCSLLLSGVERMAFGTDFYMDILFCRTGYKSVSTVASYCCLLVIWMDSCFHDFHLSISFYLFIRFIADFTFLNSFLIIAYPSYECKEIIKISAFLHFAQVLHWFSYGQTYSKSVLPHPPPSFHSKPCA